MLLFFRGDERPTSYKSVKYTGCPFTIYFLLLLLLLLLLPPDLFRPAPPFSFCPVFTTNSTNADYYQCLYYYFFWAAFTCSDRLLVPSPAVYLLHTSRAPPDPSATRDRLDRSTIPDAPLPKAVERGTAWTRRHGRYRSRGVKYERGCAKAWAVCQALVV